MFAIVPAEIGHTQVVVLFVRDKIPMVASLLNTDGERKYEGSKMKETYEISENAGSKVKSGEKGVCKVVEDEYEVKVSERPFTISHSHPPSHISLSSSASFSLIVYLPFIFHPFILPLPGLRQLGLLFLTNSTTTVDEVTPS